MFEFMKLIMCNLSEKLELFKEILALIITEKKLKLF